MEDYSNYFTQKVNPDVLHLINSGINYYQQQELKNSLASFNQAIVLMPENANLYTFRGNVYQDLGDNALAEKDFRKTIELRPNDSHANFRLGIMYSQKNDFENAVKFLEISYRNSLSANLDLIGFGTNNLLVVSRQVICNNLGNFLGQLKRYDEAIKYLKEAIEIDTNYGNPHIALGIILVQLGKINEGITYIEKAQKLGIEQATLMLQMLKSTQKQNSKYDMIFEGKLEMDSLKLLELLGENNFTNETIQLSNSILNEITENIEKIFYLESTGNLGIALNGILINNLITDPAQRVKISLVSFWALTNHINQDRLPLLVYFRTIVIYQHKEVFYKIYKEILSSDLGDANTALSKVILSTVNETINELMLFEITSIKNLSEDYFKLYTMFKHEFGNSNYDLSSPDSKNIDSTTKYFNDIIEQIALQIKHTLLK